MITTALVPCNWAELAGARELGGFPPGETKPNHGNLSATVGLGSGDPRGCLGPIWSSIQPSPRTANPPAKPRSTFFQKKIRAEIGPNSIELQTIPTPRPHAAHKINEGSNAPGHELATIHDHQPRS